VAASMAAYLVLFCDNVECVDVSRFMLHKARGYAESEEDKLFLESVNKDLRSKMEQKFDAALWFEVTGVTIADVFEKDIDVWLNAKQAKKLGMVKKINRLDPSEMQAFTQMVACGRFEEEEHIPKGGDDITVSWENILSNF
jgi:ATP-dependent protease ClpP protease subunit